MGFTRSPVKKEEQFAEDGEEVALIKEGTAGFVGSATNLLKSIMGAGMLALPSAFAAVGTIPAILLLLVAAALALTGLQLLVLASNRLVGSGVVKTRNSNFTELAKPTYPKLSFIFEGAVFFKCLLVCASYMTVAGDTLVPLSSSFLPDNASFWRSRFFWVTLSTLSIAPVTFLYKMDSLKYTSFLGLGGIAYLFVLSVIMFLGYNESFAQSIANIKPFVPFTFSSLSSFGTFIFPIYNEIKDNRSSRMFQLITLCITASSVVYAIFAISFFGVFGEAVDSNVINNLPNGIPYKAARLLYALLMLFSFPLQAFPARSSAIKLLRKFIKEDSSASKRLIAHICVTCGILVVSWTVAVTKVNLGYLIRFVGCTAGPIICYFLPATFWLKLEEDKPINRGKIAAWALIVFGTFATVVPLVALIWSLFR